MYPEILFFTSKYCAPCETVKKLLNKVNLSLFGNKLNIKHVDISGSAENIELSKKHNVLSVPTIIVGDKRLSSSIDENDITDAILQGFLSSIHLENEEEVKNAK